MTGTKKRNFSITGEIVCGLAFQVVACFCLYLLQARYHREGETKTEASVPDSTEYPGSETGETKGIGQEFIVGSFYS